MKTVLLSIKPKCCELIASGKETVEIHKNRPKIDVPFKVYIYCTNTKPYLVWGDVFRGNWETEFTSLSGYSRKEAEKIWDVFNGKVIGEFVCDRIDKYEAEFTEDNECYQDIRLIWKETPKILLQEDYLVHKRGWVLLHNPHQYKPFATCDEWLLTKAQREFLFDYFYKLKDYKSANEYVSE